MVIMSKKKQVKLNSLDEMEEKMNIIDFIKSMDRLKLEAGKELEKM